jgi:hypothetical protein
MSVYPVFYTLPVRTFVSGNKRKESIAMEKQENGKPLNSVDRFACGERPVLTIVKFLSGRTNDHIPTREEKERMSPMDRLKTGETARHIVIDTLRNNRAKRIARAYEKQEEGNDLVSTKSSIQLGERNIVTAIKVTQGHRNDHILTSEQRAEMATLQRVRTGEQILI